MLQYEKNDFLEKRGEAVGWKRFRAVTFNRSDSDVPGGVKTFDFMQSVISHHLKDPHSKALEPDCLSPRLAVMT